MNPFLWNLYCWNVGCHILMNWWGVPLVRPRGNAAVFTPDDRPRCYRNVDGVMTSIAYLPGKKVA